MPATGTQPANIASLLSEANVVLGVSAPDKESLITQLVSVLATGNADLDSDEIVAAILDRESLLSTGVGYGVALPHAKTSNLNETHVVFATVQSPVDFDSFDEEPVRLVFLMVGPRSASRRHIQILGRISRILNDETVRNSLSGAGNTEEVISIFESAESTLVPS
jgi:mannitol/fructose-specific phosphotransferase system IIA component (Ntr-type)